MPILLFSLFGIFTLCGLFAVCLWLINGWLASHALAVAVNDSQWQIVTRGWDMFLGLGAPLAAFGLLMGLPIGLLAGSRLLGLLTQKHRAEIDATRTALAAERQQIETAKTLLAEQIQNAAAQGRLEASLARSEAEHMADVKARRQKALEGRLKGAQQKAARIQKRAQLMSRNAAKPDTGLVR